MEKIIRQVDEQKRIVQITTVDERWYVRESTDKITGLPNYQYVPSVTWITGHYPKGVEFYKWLANKGWDEAVAIREAAGGRGTKVHAAVTTLLNGFPVPMDAKYLNPKTGVEEELSLGEYEALMSFVEWYKKVKPEVISNEITIWNDEIGYAGTVDLVVKIDGELWIIDLKTSSQVWPEYELQVSAYKHALKLEEEPRLAILQVGYKKNKSGYKFTEIQDKFDLFLAAKQIWKNENDGVKPSQKDFPLVLTLVEEEVTKNRNENLTRDTAKSKHTAKTGASKA